jgi:hypothetical protein
MELTKEMVAQCYEYAKNPSYTHAAIYPTGDEIEWDIVPAKSFTEAVELRADLTAPGYVPTDGRIVNLLPYWKE